MSSSYGKLFRITSWGESHGGSIGCTIDGVPPNIHVEEKDIQYFLDRRKPAASKYTSQRKEDDKILIASGLFKNKTTGAPISLIIQNTDVKSRSYEDNKDKFRPGHADYTYFKKYGIRDYLGGGRSSARETAMRVASGAIARKILGSEVEFLSAIIQLGAIKAEDRDFEFAKTNELFCPCRKTLPKWIEHLLFIRKEGSSIGAIIEMCIKGVPAGLGEPVFDKLDGELAKAIMSIGAVKGIEIGSGFESVLKRGEDNNDQMQILNDKEVFLSNNSGGILGGISNGNDLILKYVVKPTSSILKELKTIDTKGNNTTISTKGRHDPCVGIRSIAVAEAMVACVLADFILINHSKKFLNDEEVAIRC